MDALEFFKTRKRMCEATKCADCKLYHVQGGCCIAPEKEKINACEEAIAIVEQWEKEHPIKTRQSEYLKLFPGAAPTKDGVLAICPNAFSPVYKDEMGLCNRHYTECNNCCREFWLAGVEE